MGDEKFDLRVIRYLQTAARISRGEPEPRLLNLSKSLDSVPELKQSWAWANFVGALHDKNNLLLGLIPRRLKPLYEELRDVREKIISNMLAGYQNFAA